MIFEIATIVCGAAAIYFYMKWQEERIINKDLANFAQMLAYTNRELYRVVPEENRKHFREMGGPDGS